jgi:acetyl-CoA carboxylase carboxyltransferase component
MVGRQAEESGIIRAGAEMVETMSCSTVPKIVLSLNHSSGAGYYAMAGQGFDPDFALAWPTARIGVMEGDAAVQAIHGPELERLKASGQPLPPWLDARHAAARGYVDAIVDPLKTRQILSFLFEVCAR